MPPFSEPLLSPHAPPLSVIFGGTAKMNAVRQTLESVARIDIPVLIQGESGTGKELCVQLIHAMSRHDPASLVKVSCPAIPAALMETELFGYEKGAFTGAQATKRGRVEKARGGTLFLDEVGSLDLNCQAKLLQLLQDGTFSRVGGHDVHKLQTRFVSVANRNLRDQVTDGTFRLDLLYRMNTITIDMPPLRERTEDLQELTDYFMSQHARTFQVKPEPLSRAVLRQMARYDWPGNIRQLDNLVRSYVLVGDEEAVLAELMPEDRGDRGLLADIDVSIPISLKTVTKQATQELERRVILKVLRANGWNRQKTAKWLKISYRSLLYKLNEAGPEAVPRVRRTSVAKPATLTPSAFQTAPRLL